MFQDFWMIFVWGQSIRVQDLTIDQCYKAFWIKFICPKVCFHSWTCTIMQNIYNIQGKNIILNWLKNSLFFLLFIRAKARLRHKKFITLTADEWRIKTFIKMFRLMVPFIFKVVVKGWNIFSPGIGAPKVTVKVVIPFFISFIYLIQIVVWRILIPTNRPTVVFRQISLYIRLS